MSSMSINPSPLQIAEIVKRRQQVARRTRDEEAAWDMFHHLRTEDPAPAKVRRFKSKGVPQRDKLSKTLRRRLWAGDTLRGIDLSSYKLTRRQKAKLCENRRSLHEQMARIAD